MADKLDRRPCASAEQMPQEKQAFLSAEWRDLVMLNYEVDRKLLLDYVPKGTVLDSFAGRIYVSLVGFQFRRTKLFGSLAIPFHGDFEEVNLRFYVRRKIGGEDRRGVVFISEIVPKRAVAYVARLAYGENYVCLPMKHHVTAQGLAKSAKYGWQLNGAWCKLYAHATGPPIPATEGSLEQFITEHYWGYSTQRGGNGLEYNVAHVPWNVWTCSEAGFEGDAGELYGRELTNAIQRRPDSAFIADGSSVAVFKAKKID
jgi:uncharacterized protein